MPLDLATSARRLADTLSVERTADSHRLPLWVRHFLALVVVVIALLIRLSMDRWVGQEAVPYVVFNAAIAFSAFLWGRSPGITATIASALLCDYFVSPPRYVFSFFYAPGDLVPMLFFLVTGVIVSLLAGYLHSAWQLSRERHQTLGVILSSIGDAVIVADALGNVSFLNGVAEELTGWRAAEARGRKLSDVFHIVDETSRQPLESPVEKVLRTGDVVTLSNHTLLLSKDGREISIDDSGAPIRQDDGSVHGVILVFRDFTERRRQESDVQRLNRLLKARSSSSRALLHAVDETQYLQEVCRIIVEDCGHAMVWIGYAHDDDAKSISPMAFAGKEEGYLQTLHLTWADTERGRGPTGTAIRTGQVNRCPNMLNELRFAPWREQALRRGYASSIALPLLDNAKAFGALTIYSPLTDPFTPDEVQLLVELADDLAHGIQSIRLRAAHAHAQELLRSSEERLRFALEGMHAGAWELDLATSAAQRSLLHDQIFGYDAVLARWTYEIFLEHVLPEDRPLVDSRFKRAVAAGKDWDFECRITRRDGAQRWIWAVGHCHNGPDGKPARLVGIVVDITDRKPAEDKSLLYLSVLQAAANAIVITDPQGAIQWVNPAFTRLTGYSPAEALGNNPRVLNSRQHDQTFFQNMWQTILAGRVWQGEVVNRRKDGTTYVEEMTITPVTGASGEIAHFIAIKQDVTARKRAEDEVRENRAKLDAALASMTDAVFISDAQGRLTHMNHAFATFHRFRSEEQCFPFLSNYQGVFEILDDAGRILAVDQWPLSRALHGEIETGDEYTLRRTDTGETWVGSYSYAPIRDERGMVIGAVGTARDVTEQKRAKEALAQSEQRFRTLADAITQLAWIAHADGFIYWYNRRWYEYTGTTPADMEGWGWQSVHDPKVLPQVLEKWKASIAAGEPFDMIFPLRGADGQFRSFLTRAIPLKDPDGRVVQWFGTNTDVQELKRAEETRARLAAIVESTDDAILSKNLDGIILSWNAAARRLFGYQDHEIIGQPITRLLPPDRLDEEEQIRSTLQRGERFAQVETVRLAKDGRLIDVSATASPLKDSADNIIGTSTILHDITARKQAEATLKRIADELARSNKDLEQFAYVASHDLQEPLRMVTGYLQLLDRRYKEKLDQDASDFINFAVDGATRMSRLITDLLDFSRINSRGKPPEPLALEPILQRAKSNLAVSLRESNAEIIHDPLPVVRGDASQLVQLFQNLLGNAIKFRSPHRPQRVCIRAEKNDDKWCISVADQGIGLDPQYAEKIFLIFQRLHSRAEYPGTGIGLALCKRIVERHGGKIWVEGRPGHGATFFFTLPAA